FVELAAILATELLVYAFCVIGDKIKDAAAPAQAAADRLLAILFDAEEHIENLLRVPFRGNLDAILRPRERGALDGHFERRKACGRALNFRDELVGGDGVAEGPAIAGNVRAGKPDLLAIMMLPD